MPSARAPTPAREKGLVKSFKKRFFRVISDRIIYAEDPSKLALAPSGFIDMSTVFSFTINDSHTNRKMPGRGFELATNTGRVYILVADNDTELKKWQTYAENFLAQTAKADESTEEPSLLELVANKKLDPKSSSTATNPTPPVKAANSENELDAARANRNGPSRSTMLKFADDLDSMTWSMLDTSQTEAPEKKSPAPEEDTNPFKITEAEQAQVTDTKPADLKTEDDDDDEQEKEDKRKAEQEVARIKLNLLQEQLDKAKEDNATLVKQNLELKQKVQAGQAESKAEFRKEIESLREKDSEREMNELRVKSAQPSAKVTDEIDSLKRDNAMLTSKLRQSNDEASKVGALETQLSSQARKITELEGALLARTAAEESLRKSLESGATSDGSEVLSAQLASKEAEIATLKQQLAAKEAEIYKLGKEKSRATVDDVLEASIQTLKMDLLNKDMRVRELEETVEKLRISASSVKSSDLDLIEKLKQEVKAKDELANKYLEEKLMLDQKVVKVTEKVQEWNEKRKQDAELIEKMKKQFEDEKKKLVSDKAESDAKVSTITIEKNALIEKLTKDLQASNAHSLTSNSQSDEIEKLRKTLSENEQFLKLAKASEEENAEAIATYEAELEKLQTRVHELETDLKAAKSAAPLAPSPSPASNVAVPDIASDDFVSQYREMAKSSEKAKLDLLGFKEQLEILSKKHSLLLEKSDAMTESLNAKDEQLLSALTMVRELRAKLGPEGSVERTQKLQKLVDQLAAHQSQHAAMVETVQMLEMKAKSEASSRDARLSLITVELAQWREKFLDLLTKSLRKEGISADYTKDADHAKRELFFSLAREIRQNFAIRGQPVQVDIAQLFELAKQQATPWKEWDLWIKAQLKELLATGRLKGV